MDLARQTGSRVAGVTPLDPRYISLQRQVGWYWTAALSLGSLAASFILLGPRRWYWAVLLWFAVTTLVAWWSYRWAEIDYRARAYHVDEHGIQINVGVLWRSVLNVPRSRVQHTDVSQGPLERKYRLGRLIIHTAGTQYSRVELPGLEYHTALTIRDQLLPRQAADVV